MTTPKSRRRHGSDGSFPRSLCRHPTKKHRTDIISVGTTKIGRAEHKVKARRVASAFLLRKAPKPEPSKTTEMYGRTHVTYVTVQFPPITNENSVRDEQCAELVSNLRSLMDILLAIDDQFAILPWRPQTRSRTEPIITHPKFIPTVRRVLAKYVHRLFTNRGFSPFCRLRIVHNCAFAAIAAQSVQTTLESMGMQVHQDVIQATEKVKLGYTIGGHPAMVDVALLRASLPHFVPALQDVAVEIRLERVYPHGKKYMQVTAQEKKESPLAHTFYSSRLDAPLVRSALQKLYGSANIDGRYPGGFLMTFIPNVLDRQFPSTWSHEAMFEGGRRKQQSFLRRIDAVALNVIRRIDTKFLDSHDRMGADSIDDTSENSPRIPLCLFDSTVQETAMCFHPATPVSPPTNIMPLFLVKISDDGG